MRTSRPGDDFDAFVGRHYQSLVRSAFLLISDRHQAEDLVQTALFRTFMHWRRLRAPDAAAHYTRTTMVRLAIRWRQRKWRGEVPSNELPERYTLSEVDGSGVGVDVMRALARLPVEQRAVLVLRYLDDLTEPQTATVLRCSVGTVKSRASRALTALRSANLLTDDTTEATHD